MKKYSDLTEREVLAVAIASEEDGRIYVSFAENLAESYPQSARIFEQIAEEERPSPHADRAILAAIWDQLAICPYEPTAPGSIRTSQMGEAKSIAGKVGPFRAR